ncbi:MAG: hypothetical protein IKO47_12895 [Ruminococcus sp.]|nr:hypothetical protein [Ruminococcus sp.]
MKKEKTTLKPIRIPDSVIDQIEEVAAAEGSDFSKVANYRLKHFERPLTPAIAATVQEVVNAAEELVGEFAPDKISVMREKAQRVWKHLK